MNTNELFVETNLPEPLSKDEIYNCFEKMKHGDMEARDKIIIHNIKYVRDLVKRRYSNTPYDLKELVSVGLKGLVDSVDSFNINGKYNFPSYLNARINNEISNFINKEKKYINVISLNQSIETDKQGKELKIDDILCDTSFDFVEAYENKESYKVIRKIVEELPERDKYIVMKYFGFEDNKSMQMKEIADELDISIPMVSFIIKKVLKNIKNKLEILQKIKTEIYYEYNEKQIAEMLSMLPIIKTYDNKTYEIIMNVIETLSERDKYIATKYYGFIDNKSITLQEIADELGISKQMISLIIKRVLKNIKNKLDVLQEIKTEKYYECDEKQIGEMLSMLPVIKIYDNKTYEIIMNVIETLSERDKYVLMKYYGFIGDSSMTQQKIADELGISQDTVSLIIKRVLKNIKNKLEILQKIKTEIYYEYNEKQIAEMLSMLPIIKTYDNKTYEIIMNVIETLPERGKYVLMKYYGFIDNKSIQIKEIADELGITRQMVESIIKRILKNIKEKLDILEKIKTERYYEYKEKQINIILSMLHIIKAYDNKTYDIYFYKQSKITSFFLMV